MRNNMRDIYYLLSYNINLKISVYPFLAESIIQNLLSVLGSTKGFFNNIFIISVFLRLTACLNAKLFLKHGFTPFLNKFSTINVYPFSIAPNKFQNLFY